MDANSVSPLWCRRVKVQGKYRRRVQDLRIPASPSLDFLASSKPPLDLSHNESARLAADRLLSCGMGGYEEALKAEGEVDFLSELEKKYFMENGKDSNTNAEPDGGDGSGNGFESSSPSSPSTVTPCPPESKDGDSSEAGLSSKEDGKVSSQSNESNVEVYLYTENRAAGLRDVVREFIRKAEKSLAVVTDHFSDVELLCDLLEASKKRFVSVQLFLDHLNLSIFRDMWQELKLQGKDFPKFSVHSVEGQTYCAKTGRKLSGQVSETFIINDSTEALTGSFSFSCLSWMVHRTLIFFVKGSAVSHFLEEFERLSSCSTPVSGFINVSFSLTFKTSSYTNKEQKGEVRSNQTDMVRIRDWIEDGLNSHKKERAQNNIAPSQYPRPLRQPVMQHMCMQKFTKPTLGGIPAQDHTQTEGDILQRHHTYTKSKLQTNLTAYTHSTQNGLHPGTTGAASTFALWAHHRQDKAVDASTQNKDLSKGRYSLKCEEYWTQKHPRATITPPGIATGFNKHRREHNTPQPKTNHADHSKVTPSFMSPEKQCVQSGTTGFWGQTYRLQTKVRSNGTKVQDQPQRHHTRQSQTQIRSPTTSTSTQPKESNLFLPATERQPALETKAPQQVKPSSRLAWMTQTNTMGDRPMARQSSFSSYDTVHKLDDGQSKLRQFHPTSAKPLTRSKSVNERPQTRTHLQ
ncbi:uncharacterized protein [Eucyclogobius newberryi]|uniref:uncharacterized protein n=1 Tax=Eucyclogobius newberryi TaxID=166745 RepID=UPI003B5AD473